MRSTWRRGTAAWPAGELKTGSYNQRGGAFEENHSSRREGTEVVQPSIGRVRLSRSSVLGSALLLAVLSIAGSVVWSVSHPAGASGKARTSLVALRRVHAEPVISPLNGSAGISPFEMNRHFSATISNFDAGSSQPWQVGLAYQGCPRTSAGAIRLTVYMSKGLTTKRTQYSRTVVDWKGSDSATYEFPGKANTEFFYKVDVPSARGCQAWSVVVETN
jgi:hypothetical protein